MADPCTDPAVLPGAGRNAGVDPDGTRYPFLAPSPDIAGLLADLQVSIAAADAGWMTAEPWRLDWVEGLDVAFCPDAYWIAPTTLTGTDRLADARIVDADGATVVDTTTIAGYRWRRFSDRLWTHYWWDPDARPPRALRIVQHAAFGSDAEARPVPHTISPADGRLQARCALIVPRGLAALRRDGGPATTPPERVQLAAGYNTAVTAAATRTEGLRRVTRIQLDHVAGAGQGRYPGPGPAPGSEVVRRLGGATADPAGNLQWLDSPCVSVRWLVGYGASFFERVDGALVLRNRCTPCCTCNDYAAVQRAILQTWARYQAAADDVRAARQAYQEARAAWDVLQQCLRDRRARLDAVVSGRRVDVIAGICNVDETCHFGVTMRVEITPTPADTVVALDPTRVTRTEAASAARADTGEAGTGGPGSARSYSLEVERDPVTSGVAAVQAHWEAVPPRGKVHVRFPLVVPPAPYGTALRLRGVSFAGAREMAPTPENTWSVIVLDTVVPPGGTG